MANKQTEQTEVDVVGALDVSTALSLLKAVWWLALTAIDRAILSVFRVDRVSVLFVRRLVCLVCASKRTLQLSAFVVMVKFTYRNNKKYSTWYVNWLKGAMNGDLRSWNNCVTITRGEYVLLVNPMHVSSYLEQILFIRN